MAPPEGWRAEVRPSVLDTGTGLLEQQLLVLCLEQGFGHLGVRAVDGQLAPVSQQHVHRADASIEPGADVGSTRLASTRRLWKRQRGGSTVQCRTSATYRPGRQRVAAREA